MKRFALLVAGSIGLSACAVTDTPAPIVEAGYPTGSLAVAAIARADWATAERLLTEPTSVDRDDPARLVNLGRVYMATGRPSQAFAAWRAALAAHPVEVETLGGRAARTDELAREALAYYGGTVQTAARSD